MVWGRAGTWMTPETGENEQSRSKHSALKCVLELKMSIPPVPECKECFSKHYTTIIYIIILLYSLHNAPLNVPTTWVLTAILLNGGGGIRLQIFSENNLRKRQRERRQTHDVSPLRWHTERRRISRVEVPGKEKQNCRAEIIGNCKREKKKKTCEWEGERKERKEIWIKGISCPASQVASQIAALWEEATGGRKHSSEEEGGEKKNQWCLSDFLICVFFHMAPALSALFQCCIPLHQPLLSVAYLPFSAALSFLLSIALPP